MQPTAARSPVLNGSFGAGLGYPADNFMTRKARVDCVMPFVACLMKVGMANAAIEDFDLDVVRSGSRRSSDQGTNSPSAFFAA